MKDGTERVSELEEEAERSGMLSPGHNVAIVQL